VGLVVSFGKQNYEFHKGATVRASTTATKLMLLFILKYQVRPGKTNNYFENTII